MKSVADIARAVDGRVHGDGTIAVSGVQHDSRGISKGDLFAVIRGEKTDGRLYIESALSNGAVALLVDEVVSADVPQIVVDDVRAHLGRTAATVFDYPTSKLDTVGVTGTNGKTTTVYLVESALAALGRRPGVIGTVEYRFERMRWDAPHTTPEATVIQSVAAEMVAAGATHLVMETSSHGLSQKRLEGCAFKVAAFTNLTQDHLDYHGDMDAYAAAKLRLFTDALRDAPDARIVVNLDDPFGQTIVDQSPHDAITVSVAPGATTDICPAAPPEYGIRGITVLIRTQTGEFPLRSPLIGRHNLSNLLVALGICDALGVPMAAATAALCSSGAPGRLERVSTDEPFTVLVDYAHTPDALANVLAALRPLTRGRLMCVFGCGGDRDNAKRPLMGRAVRDVADVALVTSDNPRTEAPNDIIKMILPGVEGGTLPAISIGEVAARDRGYTVEPDRRTAISAAINGARPDDTVLIAGKGHEDYQVLGTETIHFDDREEARAVLAALKKGAHG